MDADGARAGVAAPPGAKEPALQLTGLVKRFGETTAVDHIDLVVPRGSFFGLVGPNGAGKTTSLSMAVGLLRPDGGSAQIFGIDVWADPVTAKRLVGVLPDGLALPERLTGRELLGYLGQLRGLDRATVAARVQELLEVLELTEAERTLVADYSAGMRKKLTLATAPGGLLLWWGGRVAARRLADRGAELMDLVHLGPQARTHRDPTRPPPAATVELPRWKSAARNTL